MDLDDDARAFSFLLLEISDPAETRQLCYLTAPRASSWVSLGKGSLSTAMARVVDSWVMHRPDVQLPAQALLQISLSPPDYSIAARESACKLMHSAALDSLPQLLITTILGVQSLGQQRQILNNLLLTMSTIYDATEPLQWTRKYFAAIFELDKAFSAAIPCRGTLVWRNNH